jgi:hypothetical protein
MENNNKSGGFKNSGNERSGDSEARKMDLTDSPHDEERLKPDEAIIELPDVKDIPGQEFVHVPSLGELGDTTISSADEEGEGLFDDAGDDDETAIVMGTEADITQEDKTLLEQTFTARPTTDDNELMRATMDNTDFEGTRLNEGSFGEQRSGADLDIPDEVDETKTDAMGQGDEENKYYSLGGDEQDDKNESTHD